MQSPAPRYRWDDEYEDTNAAGRIVPFPAPSTEGAGEEGEGSPVRSQLRYRRPGRHRRQAAEADSLTRYLLTATAMLLAVGVIAYLALQLSQLGKQAGAPAASQQPAPSAPGQAQTANGSQQPGVPPAAAATRAPAGTGQLRTSERHLEPSYTVTRGDTLGSIAAKFGTTVEALQAINNLPDRNVLSVGQKLVIPNQN